MYHSEPDRRMGSRDGPPIELIQTPEIRDCHLRAFRQQSSRNMRARGLSVKAIAKAFGISPRTVIRYTNPPKVSNAS
jgi:DNA-binding NarL/FixJ family response regulator